MKELFLVGHVGLGIASMVICLGAIAAVIARYSREKCLWLMKFIGLMAVASVISGVALVIVQFSQAAVYHLCVRLAIYLAIIVGVEGWLYFKVKGERVAVELDDAEF